MTRLNRFLREERALCDHAMAHLTPEMFEAYRDRRRFEQVSHGVPGGRGQYSPERKPRGASVRLRADGTPVAKPKPPPKPPRTVSDSTIKRELTLLKKTVDYSMRRLKLGKNPLSADEVARPTVHDARDVRLSAQEWARLLTAARASQNE